MRRQAAPVERGLVHFDRGAVELDRAHQRHRSQRHPALLPGVAEHEQVARDRVAEQRRRQLGRVDEFGFLAIERGLHRGENLLRRELHVGARRERAGHRLVGVQHDVRAAGADLRQRPVVVDDDHVATEHEVGFARGDAHGVDVGRATCAMRRWQVTAPPFCARPVWSSTVAPLFSRCAAMPISAPIVTTPVPPMPVTRMFQGCARSAGELRAAAMWRNPHRLALAASCAGRRHGR